MTPLQFLLKHRDFDCWTQSPSVMVHSLGGHAQELQHLLQSVLTANKAKGVGEGEMQLIH